MRRKGQEVRERIVASAAALFYQRGFNQASFSDIADAAEVPRGNFYYYFRSKDEILEAVVEHRVAGIRAMLAEWDARLPAPRARLRRYVDILLNSEEDILRYGCPMGSLNVELSKTQLQLQSRAGAMFEVFQDWLRRQFQALGQGRRARELALHLLAMTQGVALLSNVYGDARFLRREATRLKDWIDTVTAGGAGSRDK